MIQFIFLISLFCLGFFTPTADAQVNLDIHIGERPAAPPPVVTEPPPVELEVAPHMVYDEGLRVYIAVGIPYDLFFHNAFYFYHVSGVWYRSPYYRGPWSRTDYRKVPRVFREHRIEEFRGARERVYRDYRGHEERYRGRHFQAEEPRGRHEREIR